MNRIILLSTFFFILMSCIFYSCSSLPKKDLGNKVMIDMWYKEPCGKLFDQILFKGKKTNQSDIYVLNNKSKFLKAKKLLHEVSFVELAYKQAETYINKKIKKKPDKKPYLVRVLFQLTPYYDLKFAFSVTVFENNIWVNATRLGRPPAPMERWALIVLLKNKPKDVFVTSSLAE
ncbi:MAG: hypothetical protein IEMM0008_1040 [bacterium]|nr:MAG: hypothetical protein IEMM0008_1040 [bacterium]